MWPAGAGGDEDERRRLDEAVWRIRAESLAGRERRLNPRWASPCGLLAVALIAALAAVGTREARRQRAAAASQEGEAKPEAEATAPAPVARELDSPACHRWSRRDPCTDTPRRHDGPGLGPLTRESVVAGMNAIRPGVHACHERYGVWGSVMVNLEIRPGGRVTSAHVGGPLAGTPTARCVERAARGASFPPSQGLTISWPFTLP